MGEFCKARRRWLCLTSVVLAGSALHSLPALAAPAALDEQRAALVKENLIRHFLRMVTWPAPKQREASRLVLILGDSPELLRALRARAEAEAPRLTVLHAPTVPSEDSEYEAFIRQLAASHLTYVATSLPPGLREAMSEMPVLSVGHGREFAVSSGAIGLAFERGRIAIYVNRAHAERARLKLSAQLLQHARVVD